MDIKITRIDENKKVCGKPWFLYKTNLDSLYVSYTGGNNMKTGVPNKKIIELFF